jgi:hypothetical protein
MLSPLPPAQRLGVLLRSFTQPCQPSPIWQSGRPAHRPLEACSAFARVTDRSPIQLTNRYLDMTLKRLRLAGLRNLAEVRKTLDSRAEHVVRFAERFVGPKQKGAVTFPRGISLFFLAYVIVAESESDQVIADFISAAELKISIGHLRETYLASQLASNRTPRTARATRLAPQPTLKVRSLALPKPTTK